MRTWSSPIWPTCPPSSLPAENAARKTMVIGMAQRCRDRAAAIGESRHGPETHTPVRMMVRPAISFSSLQAWTRSGAT